MTRPDTRLLSATFGLTSLVAGCSDGPVAPPPAGPGAQETTAPGPPVELRLSTTTPRVGKGERPALRAEIVNVSRRTLLLVQPGDGSDVGWRTPRIEWLGASFDGGRCGNIDPLRAGEVFHLAPGARLELSPWIGAPRLDRVGRHELSLAYTNVPDLEWGGVPLGAHDPETMELVRRSEPVHVVSNPVEILVEE